MSERMVAVDNDEETSSTSTTTRMVAVDKDEPVLTFHDPDELASLIGMRIIPEEKARDKGAVGCSKCFDDVDCTSYQFSYLDGGIPTA